MDNIKYEQECPFLKNDYWHKHPLLTFPLHFNMYYVETVQTNLIKILNILT